MPLAFVYLSGALITAIMSVLQPDAAPLMFLLGKFMLAGFFVSALFEIRKLSRTS
ncbi:hypothetical protein AA106556_2025 [Neokomagataea tanensis NBRC 106556]|uniref:Uncharacterized protein n=2 Tax=Acetobacteraceae TaxID=433 RepID=A0ABQ0QLI7_9PROT|nr:hypothetical protein AA106556_2025 [Neokomagataea tanensis NBRC 106556]